MQAALEDFFRALRAADVRVSPAEAIDAHRTVEVVGFADRELFRDALCATLAKSGEEVARFEAVFDTFFDRRSDAVTPAPPPGGTGGDPMEGLPPEARESELARIILDGDGAALAQAMEAAAERAEVSRIRLSTQRARLTRRLLEEMGVSEIERILAAARRLGGPGEAAADRLEAARKALTAEGGIDPVDLAMMQALVKRMAKRLADRYSRRRNVAWTGHLDVRRTLRKSMGYGGMPFDIVFKTKKVDKPSIVAICDVSKSVAAAAQFLLTFLYSLNEVVDRLDAFAFSGRLISVNKVLDDHPVETAILEVLKQIGFQQTDYGKALEDFADQHMDRIDRHTTVILLGDARTNYANPRLDILATIQQRSRAVIWLNPEPDSYWSQGDSVMNRYERFCHVAKTCNTLEQLERIIEDVLRTYIPH
ncbi:MAG: vWA domain-containing protein [Alphaproteobacteria bacterium]